MSDKRFKYTIRLVPPVTLPGFAVVALKDDGTGEDLAWFWDKSMAIEYLQLMRRRAEQRQNDEEAK